MKRITIADAIGIVATVAFAETRREVKVIALNTGTNWTESAYITTAGHLRRLVLFCQSATVDVLVVDYDCTTLTASNGATGLVNLAGD